MSATRASRRRRSPSSSSWTSVSAGPRSPRPQGAEALPSGPTAAGVRGLRAKSVGTTGGVPGPLPEARIWGHGGVGPGTRTPAGGSPRHTETASEEHQPGRLDFPNLPSLASNLLDADLRAIKTSERNVGGFSRVLCLGRWVFLLLLLFILCVCVCVLGKTCLETPCGRINYAMTFRSFSALRCSEAPPKVAGAAGLELLSWWCSGKAVGGLGCECLRCWGRTDVWAPGARAESGATPFVVPLLRPLASPLCGGLVGSFHEVRFEHRRPCPQPA